MVGEFTVARQLLNEAVEAAIAENTMDEEQMMHALLSELLSHLAKIHSRSDLDSLIQYQLDSQDSDEFLVTRGC